MNKRRQRKPRKTTFEIKIKDRQSPGRVGVLHVTANSKTHAEMQARAFERDLSRYWVRAQCEISKGVFALGMEAKRALGVEVYSCESS